MKKCCDAACESGDFVSARRIDLLGAALPSDRGETRGKTKNVGAAQRTAPPSRSAGQGGLILVLLSLSHSSAAVLLGRLEHSEVASWTGATRPSGNVSRRSLYTLCGNGLE